MTAAGGCCVCVIHEHIGVYYDDRQRKGYMLERALAACRPWHHLLNVHDVQAALAFKYLQLCACLQPPKEFSTAKQTCHIVLDLAAQSYISNASFPCSMVPAPFEQLGAGCCYDPPRRRRQ